MREIGSGGMGRVFQAVDTETGETVAAKILITREEPDLPSLLRFQAEGLVLATLKHPNIVRVHGTHQEEHTSCIIMEFLDGQSLGQILRTEQLSLARSKHLMQQAASALAFAHGRGVVHRDVKPDNIMVVGDDYVKVTDFGIARILQETTDSMFLTPSGMVLGTPLYTSPEQIEGQKVDGRSDIYSFGAVLYQMITSRPPFEGSDPLTIAFQHVHRPPQPPRELKPEVPEEWEALILRCLAKDPGERFQSAVALQEALSALPVESRPALAPRPHPGAERHDREIATTEQRAPTKTARGQVHLPQQKHHAGRPAPMDAGFDQPPRSVVQPPVPVEIDVGAPTAVREAGRRVVERPLVSATPVPSTRQKEEKKPFLRLPVLGGIAALVAILAIVFGVVLASSGHKPGPTPVPTPNTVPSLLSAGTAHAVSGRRVTLRWAAVRKATEYHLEVATASTDPGDSAVFKHPMLNLDTTETSYSLKVAGFQYYYWRVRAEVGGVWRPYSHSQHLKVPKPAIGHVWLLLPKNGTRSTAKQIRLCWTAVKGAYDYRLQITGSRSTHVHGTCIWISVYPGSYHWRVAARVKAAHLYVGSYSARASFSIRRPVPPTPTPVPPTPVPPTPTPVPPTPVPPTPTPVPPTPTPVPSLCPVSC